MIKVPSISDADERCLEQIADDCGQVLGGDVELSALQLASNAEIVLRLTYRLGSTTRLTEGRGPNLIAAHSDLRRRLVEDRIGLGLRSLLAR
jgi:hypothetical protein